MGDVEIHRRSGREESVSLPIANRKIPIKNNLKFKKIKQKNKNPNKTTYIVTARTSFEIHRNQEPCQKKKRKTLEKQTNRRVEEHKKNKVTKQELGFRFFSQSKVSKEREQSILNFQRMRTQNLWNLKRRYFSQLLRESFECNVKNNEGERVVI